MNMIGSVSANVSCDSPLMCHAAERYVSCRRPLMDVWLSVCGLVPAGSVPTLPVPFVRFDGSVLLQQELLPHGLLKDFRYNG